MKPDDNQDDSNEQPQFEKWMNGGHPINFASGINLVPSMVPASLLRGEAVVPANMNPFNPNAKTSESATSDDNGESEESTGHHDKTNSQ